MGRYWLTALAPITQLASPRATNVMHWLSYGRENVAITR
jgi:hypothetical protein